jgi:hypothetical protein
MKKLFTKQNEPKPARRAEAATEARAALAEAIETRRQAYQDVSDAENGLQVARREKRSAEAALEAVRDAGTRRDRRPDDYADTLIRDLVEGKDIAFVATTGPTVAQCEEAVLHWQDTVRLLEQAIAGKKRRADLLAASSIRDASKAVILAEMDVDSVVEHLARTQEFMIALRTALAIAIDAGYMPSEQAHDLMMVQKFPTGVRIPAHQSASGIEHSSIFHTDNPAYQAWLDAMKALEHDAYSHLPEVS